MIAMSYIVHLGRSCLAAIVIAAVLGAFAKLIGV